MLSNGTTSCIKLPIGDWEPFIYIANQTPPYQIEGAAVDILMIILSKLQLCYEFVRGPLVDFGSMLPNGTWTGAMGLLTRGEADMSAVLFMVSESRAKAVDFSEQVYTSDQTISYTRPELESDMLGFIKPYTYGMWLSIFLSILVVLIVWLLIQKGYSYVSFLRSNFSDNEIHVSSSDDAKEADTNNVSVWTFSVILTQSVPWEPKADSMRIMAGIWLIMAFILATVYRSNLVAMLVAPSVKLPFDNLEELSKTDHIVHLSTGTRFDEALNNAEPGSILSAVRKNFIKDVPYNEAVAGFFARKWGATSIRHTLNYGLHRYYSTFGKCGHYIMSAGIFKTTMISFAFPKKSPLKAKVDPYIRNLREFGIMEHLLKKRMPNATECLKPISSGVTNQKRPLDIKDLLSCFLILLGGLFISTLVFIAEIIGAH